MGLIPYAVKDAPLFFGRDRERRVITANLEASRLTLLYGESGVGKSSLLNAGVAYHLRRAGSDDPYAGARLLVQMAEWTGDPTRTLAELVSKAAQDHLVDGGARDQSFVELLEATNEQFEGDVLVVLDQFEEFFTYHAGRESGVRFVDQFSRAVRNPELHANFLLVIREDALADLDLFKGHVQGLFENRIRLTYLEQAAAREAIVEPPKAFARMTGVLMRPDDDLVDEVLKQLAAGRFHFKEASRLSGSEDGKSVRIEAPYLQLVMSRLWERERDSDSRRLRRKTLEELGGATRIVEMHLDEAMRKLPLRQQEVAAAVFHFLVTPSGMKMAHRLSDLASYAEIGEDELRPVLSTLAGEVRILRPVSAPDAPKDDERFEIFHDALAPAVLDWQRRFLDVRRQREVVAAAQPVQENVGLAELAATHRDRQRELEKTSAVSTETEVRYLVAEATFEAEHGTILNAYFARRTPSAVAITLKQPFWLRRLLFGDDVRFHQVSDSATRESPALAEVMSAVDALSIRARQTLEGTSLRLAMEMILAVASRVLATTEGPRRRDARAERAAEVLLPELTKIDTFVTDAARRSAALTYIKGILLSCVLLPIVPALVAVLAAFEVMSSSLATGISVAVVAGAVGAAVSGASRVGRKLHIGPAVYDIGKNRLVVLGALRPLVGAYLGAGAYLVSAAFPGFDVVSDRIWAVALLAFALGALLDTPLLAAAVKSAEPAAEPRPLRNS